MKVYGIVSLSLGVSWGTGSVPFSLEPSATILHVSATKSSLKSKFVRVNVSTYINLNPGGWGYSPQLLPVTHQEVVFNLITPFFSRKLTVYFIILLMVCQIWHFKAFNPRYSCVSFLPCFCLNV